MNIIRKCDWISCMALACILLLPIPIVAQSSGNPCKIEHGQFYKPNTCQLKPEITGPRRSSYVTQQNRQDNVPKMQSLRYVLKMPGTKSCLLPADWLTNKLRESGCEGEIVSIKITPKQLIIPWPERGRGIGDLMKKQAVVQVSFISDQNGKITKISSVSSLGEVGKTQRKDIEGEPKFLSASRKINDITKQVSVPSPSHFNIKVILPTKTSPLMQIFKTVLQTFIFEKKVPVLFERFSSKSFVFEGSEDMIDMIKDSDTKKIVLTTGTMDNSKDLVPGEWVMLPSSEAPRDSEDYELLWDQKFDTPVLLKKVKDKSELLKVPVLRLDVDGERDSD